MDLADFQAALATLPPDQREALILIGASGFTYEEAAEICDCAVGTIKSRVNRARQRLMSQLSIGSAAEFGPDPAAGLITKAVLADSSNL
jgi:RNA polymerase sigma-70 factor (ECF subfamily)